MKTGRMIAAAMLLLMTSITGGSMGETAQRADEERAVADKAADEREATVPAESGPRDTAETGMSMIEMRGGSDDPQQQYRFLERHAAKIAEQYRRAATPQDPAASAPEKVITLRLQADGQLLLRTGSGQDARFRPVTVEELPELCKDASVVELQAARDAKHSDVTDMIQRLKNAGTQQLSLSVLEAASSESKGSNASSQNKLLEHYQQSLRETVTRAFETRQAMQQAEVKRLRQRLARIERQITARERIKGAIIDRRVEELLNPELKWESTDEIPSISHEAQKSDVPLDRMSPLQRTARRRQRELRIVIDSPRNATLLLQINGKDGRHLRTTLPVAFSLSRLESARFSLREIPGHPELEVLATLDTWPLTDATSKFVDQDAIHLKSVDPNAIHLNVTDEDLKRIASKNPVWKVIYLARSDDDPTGGRIETIVNTRLDPNVDPLAEAERRGDVLALLKLGTPERPPEHAEPAESSTASQSESSGHLVVFPLQSASAAELLPILNDLGIGGKELAITADRRTNSLMAHGSRERLDRLADLIRILDQPSGDRATDSEPTDGSQTQKERQYLFDPGASAEHTETVFEQFAKAYPDMPKTRRMSRDRVTALTYYATDEEAAKVEALLRKLDREPTEAAPAKNPANALVWIEAIFVKPPSDGDREEPVAMYRTGTVIGSDGVIATVFDPSDQPTKSLTSLKVHLDNGRIVDGHLVRHDEKTGVAFLKVDVGGLPYLELSQAPIVRNRRLNLNTMRVFAHNDKGRWTDQVRIVHSDLSHKGAEGFFTVATIEGKLFRYEDIGAALVTPKGRLEGILALTAPGASANPFSGEVWAVVSAEKLAELMQSLEQEPKRDP